MKIHLLKERNEKEINVSTESKELMIDHESQKAVIKFFEGLEEYGIKFSDNQRNMLISVKNTLILGRSGTGKTTISAFKILALDLLFMAFKKKKLEKSKSYTLKLKDLQKYSGCNTVF